MRFVKFRGYFFLILSNIVLYIFKISNDSFWRDEAFSINLSKLDIRNIIKISTLDTASPTYSIFLHYYFKFFPIKEFWARLPSVIFMIFAIFLVVIMLKRIFKVNRNVLLGLLLIICNPVLFWYAREARVYSMLMFFSLLTLIFSIFLKEVKYKVNGYMYIIFILSNVFGLYIHNIFILIIIANLFLTFGPDCRLLILGIFRLNFNIKIFKSILIEKRYLVFSYIIIFFLYLPLFFVIYRQISFLDKKEFWFEFEPLHDLKMNLLKVYIFEPTVFKLNTLVTILLYITFVISIITLLSNLFSLLLNKITNFWYKNISMWFWALGSLFFIYSFKTPIFYIRYMIFLIPIVLIINIYELKRFRRDWGVWMIVVFLTVSSFSTFGYLRFSGKNKADMRTLVNDICVSENKKSNILILHAHAYTYHAFNLYCSDNFSYIYTPREELPFYEGIFILSDQDFFTGNLSKFNSVYNIYLKDKDSELLDYNLRSFGFILSARFEYDGNLFLEKWENI